MEDSFLNDAERDLMRRVRKTQLSARRVDLFATLCAFATIALTLLLLGIVIDCWILPNGFSLRGRVVYAAFWSLTSVIFFIFRLIPVFRRRVNILYAAKELENAWSDKHNLTINWIQLCKSDVARKGEDSSTARSEVLKNISLQATNFARKQEIDVSVDYTTLIHWGIAFTVVLAVCSCYIVISSKNPFVGASRIIAPFAKIDRPQALRFESITPGDASVFQGDFLEIEAIIPGANESKVELLYSTLDNRLVDIPVPMESKGLSKFIATLPNTPDGFSDSVVYRVVVARGSQMESSSKEFFVDVRPQPSFRVESLELDFPSYTGYSNQTFENQGDIRAIEGTKVSIRARANSDLARANIWWDANPARSVKMNLDPQNPRVATYEFVLGWAEDDDSDELNPKKQDFYSYRLVSRDVDNCENRDQQDFQVSIIPDLPPTVRWINAPVGLYETPQNQPFTVSFEAEDPDFSIKSVKMTFAPRSTNANRSSSSNKDLIEIDVPLNSSNNLQENNLTGNAPDEPRLIEFEISPVDLKLNVDEEIEYSATVYDSKSPQPNEARTEKRFFKVIPPVANPDVKKQDPEKNEASQESNEGNSDSNSERNNPDDSTQDNPSNEENQADNTDEQTNSEQNESSQQGQSEQTANETQSDNSNNSDGATSSSEENSKSQDSASDGSDSESKGSQNAESSDSNNKGRNDTRNDTSSRDNTDSSDESASTSSSGNANDSSSSDVQASQTPGQESSNDLSDKSDSLSGKPTSKEEDAFETILDYIQEQSAEENSEQEDKTQQEGRSDSNSSNAQSNRSNNENTDETSHDNSPENASDFSGDADDSRESNARQNQNDLPDNANPNPLNDESSARNASPPETLDPNIQRTYGNVDPETNNFLAQNPNDQSQVSNNRRDDANINLDPLDQSDAVAADSYDEKSPEAKGNSNSNVPDAPYEVDRTPDVDGVSNNGNETVDINDLPEGVLDDAQSKTNGQNGSESHASGNNEKKGNDQNKQSRNDSGSANKEPPSLNLERGSGGSGMGELGTGEQTLAPADSPNLRYAERASNLVLNYLDDVLAEHPKEELLQRLGWSEEQLRDFLRRWKEMRGAAESGDRRAQKEYLESLESINFSERFDEANEVNSFSSSNRTPNRNNNRNSSARENSRIKTPERIGERVRAYSMGSSRLESHK